MSAELPGHRHRVVGMTLFGAAIVAYIGLAIVFPAGFLNPYFIPNSAFAIVGAVLVWHRPRHILGWLFLVVGMVDAMGMFLTGLQEASSSLRLQAWASSLAWAAITTGTSLMPVSLLLFPDGRPPSPRWRPLVWLGAVVCVVGGAAGLLSGAFFGLATDGVTAFGDAGKSVASAISPIAVGIPALMVFGFVSLAQRWRRAHGIERQQLKVLVAAVAAVVLAAAVMPFIQNEASAESSVQDLVVALCQTGIPIAAGIAILRFRLWEFDLVLSRSLVVLLLTALVTAVYAAVVVGGGRLVQRGTDDLMLQVLATALIAVAFAPAREVATRVANRVVFGRRATPYEVLAEVTDQMGGSVAESEALDRVAALLAAGTGAATTTVWLRTNGDLRPAAVWPAERSAPQPLPVNDERLPEFERAEIVHPVRDGEELLGALTLTTPRDEGLTAAERRVVEDMVSSVGILLRRVRLDAELAARVAELRASRQRLVTAQDGARRHLERDLHDGAQQQLVAVKVRLGIARSLATREGDEQLAERLADLAAQTDDAVDELRAIAHGIYPPLLAAEGLPAAFATLARRQPIDVTLAADGVGRHPEPVEATAYFALAQLLEGAVGEGVEAVEVVVAEDAGDLRLTVSAPGYAPDVAALVDRIDATGGALAVAPGTVTIRLPAGVPA